MNAAPARVAREPIGADRFLDTSSTRSASLWHDVLGLQVDLFFPHELARFLGSTSWHAAGSVLDIGCGNGDYVARLRSFFPEKAYTGIDVSDELTGLAIERHQAAGLDFQRADFFAFDPPAPFDVLLMRFIVQHLADLGAVLIRAGEMMKPGGSIFIIEPDLARSANAPRTPVFEGMLAGYQRQAGERGRLRTQLADITDLITAVPGWTIADDARLTVPRIGPFTGTKVLDLYLRWIDLCEQSSLFAYPFDLARRELEAWSAEATSFSGIGLRILQLQYLADGPASRPIRVLADAEEQEIRRRPTSGPTPTKQEPPQGERKKAREV